MTARGIRRLLPTLALLVALAPWPAAARMPPLDDLLRQYLEIAFRNEIGGAHRFGRIIKWQEPIRARLDGPHAEAYKPEVESHFARLAQLTGLTFEIVEGFRPFASINMTITFVDTGGRGPADPEAACLARTFEDEGFVIRRAEIMITADIPELRRHCILEEITQALGLMNDSPILFPSIFHDDSQQAALAPWDELMIFAHYDPRLRPGMTSAEVMPIVREIFVQERAKLVGAGRPPGNAPSGTTSRGRNPAALD